MGPYAFNLIKDCSINVIASSIWSVIIIAISPELVTHFLFMSRFRENFCLANDVSPWNEICDYNNDEKVMVDTQVPQEYV